MCEHLPATFKWTWMETNNGNHGNRLEEGMGDITGKKGSHHLPMSGCVHLGIGEGTVCPGESSGSQPHAQSWSITLVHWIVPNYLVFLIYHFPFMKQTKNGLII